MKLWLDDIREAPEGWERATTIGEAKLILAIFGGADEVSLDHDLGESDEGQTGYDFLMWCIANDKVPPIVKFHTMNPVGKKRMEQALENYYKNMGP